MPGMAKSPVLYRVEDRVGFVSINQPGKMNRLSFKAMAELARAVELADQDPAVRVIVISGVGEKAFCAGGDLEDFEADCSAHSKEKLGGYAQLCLVFNRITTPSIAMIRGYAMAGGCGLAMLPAFGIASDDAVFGLPEIKAGLWPMMVMAILFRTVGRKKGLELICTGQPIDAQEALRIGMINKVAPGADLEQAVLDLSEQLKGLSGSVLGLGLEAFNHIGDLEYDKAVSYLQTMAAVLTGTPDAIEGRQAFIEKRKPVWRK